MNSITSKDSSNAPQRLLASPFLPADAPGVFLQTVFLPAALLHSEKPSLLLIQLQSAGVGSEFTSSLNIVSLVSVIKEFTKYEIKLFLN